MYSLVAIQDILESDHEFAWVFPIDGLPTLFCDIGERIPKYALF
jgi:hypothetical protein